MDASRNTLPWNGEYTTAENRPLKTHIILEVRARSREDAEQQVKCVVDRMVEYMKKPLEEKLKDVVMYHEVKKPKSNGLGDLAGAVSVVKPVGLRVEDVKQWTGAEA